MTITKNEIQSVNYVYQGNPINFRINGKVMVSANNMAAPFGNAKRPKYWLETKQAKEFLQAYLESKGGNPPLGKAHKWALADLVIVKKGGVNPGTWFHEDVALEFARWLSPAFAIWCNDRIKEILLQRMGAGVVPAPPVLETQRAIECPPEDKELLKWKNCFKDSMAVINSMHEDNKLLLQTMKQNQSTLNNFVHSYIRPDNRMTHVPESAFNFIMSLGEIIKQQQQTFNFIMERR